MLDVKKMTELLWAALMESGYGDQAKLLKRQASENTNVMRDILTRMEREVNNPEAHRAIVLFKSVMGGKRELSEFEEQCMSIMGL